MLKYSLTPSAADAMPFEHRHPIQRTISRVGERFRYLPVNYGPIPEGWQRASDVVSDADAVRELLDEVGRRHRITEPKVAASYLVLGYFWLPMAASLACYLLDRRIPDLSPSAVAFQLSEGLTFMSPRCWVLPEDPAASQPDTQVVGDLAALREQLIRQLEEYHATPLFNTLRTVAPLGKVAMRANYVDRLAAAVLWLANLLGDAGIAQREVPAMVALADPTSRTGIREVEVDGRSRLLLERSGCCFSYRIDGDEKCATCPLRPLEERIALLAG